MKKIIIVCFAYFLGNLLNAQGNLPMYWNMNDPASAPTGWKLNQGTSGNFVYTSSNLINSAPAAIRLDFTGEYVQANWIGKADTVKFYMSGTGTSGTWKGTLAIDESVDGASWTNVKEFTDNLNLSIAEYMVRVKSSSRFVRFFYKAKISGYNLSIDDVTIRPAASGMLPEIQVSYKNANYANGSTIKAGNDTMIKIGITNKSLGSTLTVNDVVLSGLGKNDFTLITELPFDVEASNSVDLEFSMNSKTLGNHEVDLEILSNDSEGNNSFKLGLKSIYGSLATQPTQQPTAFSVSTKPWRMSTGFNGVGNDGYLMLVGSPSDFDLPIDGNEYQRGEYIGKSRVVYSGPDPGKSLIDIDNIIANTTYSVRLFSYNGYSKFTNYLTQNPAVQVAATPGLMPLDYYDNISVSDTNFVKELHSLIRPHRQVYYSNYASTLVSSFEARDTTNGNAVVDCFYSGYNYVYQKPFFFDVNNPNYLSREHAYPYSWMPEISKDSSNYSDLHILRLVHQNKVNAVRSNYPVNNLKSVTSSFYGGKFGLDSSNQFAYEPRDFAKGAMARAMFYICATYNRPGRQYTIPPNNQFLESFQDQNVLKRWNKQFPPNNWEIARHELIATPEVQGNRNPFVDFPDWACFIDFSNMTYNASGDCSPKSNLKVTINKVVSMGLAPNPANESVQLDLKSFGGKAVTVYVLDYFERTIYEEKTNSASIKLNTQNWTPGTYLILVRSDDGTTAASPLLKP
jgi:hypothetical protein